MNRWRVATIVLAVTLLLTLVLPSALAADTTPHKGDYIPAHNFKIEIDGVISGGFKEITGLESEVEVVAYRDGSDPITHKRPGAVKYGNIVIVRGWDPKDKSMATWYKETVNGVGKRKSGAIIFVDSNGEQTGRYNFFEAWPCRIKVYDPDGSGPLAMVEEIEFVVEKVERN